MAAEAHAPTASEYIVHHLQHLQNVNQTKIVDFTVINYDSIIVGLVLGVLTLLILWSAARNKNLGIIRVHSELDWHPPCVLCPVPRCWVCSFWWRR